MNDIPDTFTAWSQSGCTQPGCGTEDTDTLSVAGRRCAPRWRDIVVDEDDFRLACHLVSDWRQNGYGNDTDLIDRIAAVITAARRGDV